jgi:hypothetical protein
MSNPSAVVRTWNEIWTSNYWRLYPNNPFIVDNEVSKGDFLFQWFAHPAVPFIGVAAYLLLSKPVFSFIRKTFSLEPKGAFIQTFTIFHSALLAVYSIWTMINTWKIAVPLIAEKGLYPTICDTTGDIWFNRGMGFWVTHFYISKFYEFIDTW